MRPSLAVFACALGALALFGCGDDATSAPDAGVDAGVDAGLDAGLDAAMPACTPPATVPSTCNGDEALCARAYDEVAYATTHNAHSSEADAFFKPNQRFGLTRQLEDGVRALMLDTYDPPRGAVGPQLCHGVCSVGLGMRPL